MRVGTAIFAAILSAALAGCGGGGDPPAVCQPGVSTMQFPNGCLDAAAGAGGIATLTLSLTDSSGAAITQVAPANAGELRALLKDAKGVAVPKTRVSFTTGDKTGVFVPSSGTALTDANGLARVGLPAGTQAGAFTATANAVASGVATTGRIDYAVTFPTLTLSALAITPASLSAGGTASLGVTVLNGPNPFTPAQSVSFTSPCAAAGKATISSPVVTVNGVASTSYTDKGCGGADTITAATSLADATFTRTGTVTVLAATAGQIAFVSALPQNIAMKGTGGPGRQESSTVKFKVLDKNGNPVAGAVVDFFVFSNTGTTSGTGGLTLNPTTATSGADGTVFTVVASGIVNTPVRISATISGTNPAVTSISDQLVISTGIPDQGSFSLSTEIFNVEGMNHDGCDTPIGSRVRVSLADHFNNPVPDGTAVSFTAEGGTVDASCLTGLVNTTLTDGAVITQKGIPGQCSVRFCAAQPRSADGRITILAYALGEEDFQDDPNIPNSINRYDPSENFDDLCEPFRSDRAITNGEANSTVKSANPDKGESACPTPEIGEPYIDTNGDGLYTKTGNGQYNGVLNFDPVTQQTVANSKTPAVHVRASLVQVLSTSGANLTALGALPVALSHCVDGTPFVNVPKTLPIAIRDGNPTVFAGNILPGNILPAGTTIEFTASNGKILS
ncbi:MAG: hypothetical protein OEM00_09685, partial [Burkholderiaceae bacterium]|nr:hypothetical protein [Burkholderiaceae bacterium]